jgi:hypothetical protein
MIFFILMEPGATVLLFSVKFWHQLAIKISAAIFFHLQISAGAKRTESLAAKNFSRQDGEQKNDKLKKIIDH